MRDGVIKEKTHRQRNLAASHQEDDILLELLDLVGSSNFRMLVANLELENLSKPRLIN